MGTRGERRLGAVTAATRTAVTTAERAPDMAVWPSGNRMNGEVSTDGQMYSVSISAGQQSFSGLCHIFGKLASRKERPAGGWDGRRV
jgi:hypothetical protein